MKISSAEQIFISVHKIFNLILWSTEWNTRRHISIFTRNERSNGWNYKTQEENLLLLLHLLSLHSSSFLSSFRNEVKTIQGHFMNLWSKLFSSAIFRNIFRLKWMERNKIARRDGKFIWNHFSHLMSNILKFTIQCQNVNVFSTNVGSFFFLFNILWLKGSQLKSICDF